MCQKVTCADFLKVTEPATEQEVQMKTYIKHNSNNTRLESRRDNIYSTHETPANNNLCQTCGEIETVRHITNECPAYQYERQILVEN